MVKTIRFEKDLYSAEAVETAIIAFNETMPAYSRETDDELIVCLDTDNKMLAAEFCNYVLGITKRLGWEH